MSDWMDKILKYISHNRYLFISFVLAVAVTGGLVALIGCESMTIGLMSTEKVNRAEFNRQVINADKTIAVKRVELDALAATYNEEVTAFNKQVEAGAEDLDRQDEFRKEILSTISLVAVSAAEGTLNPVSLIPLGIGIFGGFMGLGAAGDNRRKDRVITDLKRGPPTA